MRSRRSREIREYRQTLFDSDGVDLVLFEPADEFDPGVVGVTHDDSAFVYSYERLVRALAKSYMRHDGKLTRDEAETMAIEWLEYNTIRSLPYMGEHAPVVIKDIC